MDKERRINEEDKSRKCGHLDKVIKFRMASRHRRRQKVYRQRRHIVQQLILQQFVYTDASQTTRQTCREVDRVRQTQTDSDRHRESHKEIALGREGRTDEDIA